MGKTRRVSESRAKMIKDWLGEMIVRSSGTRIECLALITVTDGLWALWGAVSLSSWVVVHLGMSIRGRTGIAC